MGPLFREKSLAAMKQDGYSAQAVSRASIFSWVAPHSGDRHISFT